MTEKEINENAVYQFCQDRWDYYQAQDGGYYPSKHDSKVFKDVSREFGITPEDAEAIFNKVDKIRTQQKHIENLSKAQMVDLFREIVEGNAETPWGAENLNSKQ